MTPEEVARLHQFREGFTLVDYAEVGLPIFRLTIEAVTTSHRQMPTIQEFVLRSLALGIQHEDQIARMLGLNLNIVQAATNMLVSDGFVARQAAPPDRESFRLTEAGRARLEEEQVEELKEEMLVIDYDGIRRLPIRLAGTNVLRPSELRGIGGIEIRPYPADTPPLGELAIPDVTRVVRRQRGEDFRRTVLALKRIVRRNNVYREAVALVFAADRGAEVQVAFAADGKLLDLHERAFAEHGGPRKMGFVKALGEGGARRRIERLVGKELVRSYPSKESLAEVLREEQQAETSTRALRAATQGASRNAPASLALRDAEERLGIARHALQSMHNGSDGAWIVPLDARLWSAAVADGMGGHQAGGLASEIAIAELHSLARPFENELAVKAALERVNERMYDEMLSPRGRPGMGCTVAGVAVRGDQAIFYNVGDSRAYLLHGSLILQQSVDHTLEGRMSAYGRSHSLTQSLGGASRRVTLTPHVKRMRVSTSDVMLLCSDGLTDMLGDDEILSVLHRNTHDPAATLLAAALDAGGHDNITVMVIAHLPASGLILPDNAR